jgi:hypothetical protein
VEITVAEPEPVASTYKFSYEVPADVVAGQEVEVPVTFKTDGQRATLATKESDFKFTAQGPGDVTFKAVDSNEVEHTFTNEGYWGTGLAGLIYLQNIQPRPTGRWSSAKLAITPSLSA